MNWDIWDFIFGGTATSVLMIADHLVQKHRKIFNMHQPKRLWCKSCWRHYRWMKSQRKPQYKLEVSFQEQIGGYRDMPKFKKNLVLVPNMPHKTKSKICEHIGR